MQPLRRPGPQLVMDGLRREGTAGVDEHESGPRPNSGHVSERGQERHVIGDLGDAAQVRNRVVLTDVHLATPQPVGQRQDVRAHRARSLTRITFSNHKSRITNFGSSRKPAYHDGNSTSEPSTTCAPDAISSAARNEPVGTPTATAPPSRAAAMSAGVSPTYAVAPMLART